MMSKSNTRADFNTIATVQVTETATTKNWLVKLEENHVTQALYKLALKCRHADRLPDTEILATFFTPEAISLLMTMPNRHWFWRVAKEANICHSSQSASALIHSNDVQGALRQIQLQQQSFLFMFNFHCQLAEFTAAQAMLLMDRGVLLLERTDMPTPVIVRNPIFERPPATG